MKSGVKRKDLENALDLLGISQQELDQSGDIKKLEQRLQKKWHPDRAIGLGLDDQQIQKHTRIFQKIPTCLEVFRHYFTEGIAESLKEKIESALEVQSDPGTLSDYLKDLVKVGRKGYAEKLAASLLIKAVIRNDKETVEELLEFGAQIDGHYTGSAPLCLVVKNNNLEMAKVLLSLGASPNVEMDRRSVLVYALDNQNLELAEELLKSGADPERLYGHASDHHYGHYQLNWTLLMDRIEKSDLPTIQLLLKYGANINAVATYTTDGSGSKDESKGWTALLEAVRQEKIDVVEFLLQNGADVSSKSKQGMTAQQLASQMGNKTLFQLIQTYSILDHR